MTTKPLSLAELQAISDEEVQERVAMAHGWVRRADLDYMAHNEWRNIWAKDGYCTYELPDYLHDLNAVARAEETLTDGDQWCAYYALLDELCEQIDKDSRSAPAKQRAIAFLATMQNQ